MNEAELLHMQIKDLHIQLAAKDARIKALVNLLSIAYNGDGPLYEDATHKTLYYKKSSRLAIEQALTAGKGE